MSYAEKWGSVRSGAYAMKASESYTYIKTEGVRARKKKGGGGTISGGELE
jgi:hypothetical protein